MFCLVWNLVAATRLTHRPVYLQVRNEIAVLKKVSMGHQNILTLVDYFETMNNLYLVTDLALGGELFDRICRKGSYYESDAADLIRAVLSAVAYLHDHGIVHRDLKPENLLFRTPEDNADLLIADFGLSRIMDEEQFHVLTTTCGTPGYMAPEIFKKTGHGKPVDLWALGVITYFLLCGYTPFDRDSDFEEMQAILNADYSFTPIEYWRGVSDSAKDFIRRCLTIDPGKRMTAHEALQHPFVAGWARVAAGGEGADKGTNLLPTVKKNFNARRTLHAAIDTVRAINKLREGQAGGFMNGIRSREPVRGNPAANGNSNGNGNETQAQAGGGERKDNPDQQSANQAQSQSQDSGYDTQSQTNDSGAAAAANNTNGHHHGSSNGNTDGDDVNMEDAPASDAPPPPSHLPPAYAVPSSLRPGSEANRVVETSKGLWSGGGVSRRS
jgi:serine/threonine protein kinase